MKVFSIMVDAFLYGETLKSVMELEFFFWAWLVIITVVWDEVKHNMLLGNKLRNEMLGIKKDSLSSFQVWDVDVKKVCRTKEKIDDCSDIGFA